MSDIDDGGPAFPVAESHAIAAQLNWTCGMSLRDYFAATRQNDDDLFTGPEQTLMMERPCPDWTTDPSGAAKWLAEFRAMWHYMQADAMIKRSKE